MRSGKGIAAASLWVSLVVLALLACCLKLQSVLLQRSERQRASLTAVGVSRLLFLVATTEGEVETEFELPEISSLGIQAGNPVEIHVTVGGAQATEHIFLPLPVLASSWISPSKLRVLKSGSLLLVKAQ